MRCQDTSTSLCPCGCGDAGHVISRFFVGEEACYARVKCKNQPDHGACSRLIRFESEAAMKASPAYAGDLCYAKGFG